LDPHTREHVFHRRAHVVGDHDLHRVVLQEARHACVVFALGSGVVQATPSDVELLPAVDLIGTHVGYHHAVSPAPTRVYRAVDRNRYACDHCVAKRTILTVCAVDEPRSALYS
jgi:hypothetical protein